MCCAGECKNPQTLDNWEIVELGQDHNVADTATEYEVQQSLQGDGGVQHTEPRAPLYR
jgi:hypothetical protein